MTGTRVLWALALFAGCADVRPPVPPEASGEPPGTAIDAPSASASAEAVAESPASVPSSQPSSGAPSASSSASLAASAGEAPRVPAALSFGKLKFEGGEVPKAEASVQKLAPAFVACVNEAGGVRSEGVRGAVSFLVRAAGIAEGAAVVADGLSDATRQCIQRAIAKKRIGDPSSDPVGVTAELIFTPKKS
jgi:hypothetical protein